MELARRLGTITGPYLIEKLDWWSGVLGSLSETSLSELHLLVTVLRPTFLKLFGSARIPTPRI